MLGTGFRERIDMKIPVSVIVVPSGQLIIEFLLFKTVKWTYTCMRGYRSNFP